MKRLLVPLIAGFCLSGCLAATAVSMIGSGLYNGAKIAGKTVYYAGKGVYKIGELTVRAADGVLDGTERVLRLTILTMDATGSVVRTSKLISSTALEAELAVLEQTPGVVEVIVEAAD